MLKKLILRVNFMPIVVPFNLNNVKNEANHADPTEMIRRELSSLSTNQQMIDTVIERIKPFIAVLDYDLGLHVEVNERSEEAMLDLVPAVQDLQTRMSDLIAEIIAERILHEVSQYYAEHPTSPK